jgi:hypothetical protein
MQKRNRVVADVVRRASDSTVEPLENRWLLTSVGINFEGGYTSGATVVNPTLVNNSANGAGIVAQSNWNNEAGTNGSAGTVIDSTGATLAGMTVTWSAGGTWAAATNPPADQQEALNTGFLNSSGNGTPVKVTVTNIPYAQYDVYVYTLNDAARTLTTTANGVTYYGNSPIANASASNGGVTGFFLDSDSSTPFTYIQATSRTQGSSSPNSDYVQFRMQSGSTWSMSSADGGNGYVNGIEIVDRTGADAGAPDSTTVGGVGVAPVLTSQNFTTNVTLTWGSGAPGGASQGILGGASYKIFRSTSTGTETLLTTITGQGTTKFVDTTATPAGTTYFYKISAVSPSGTEGPQSNEAKGAIDQFAAPATPTNFKAVTDASASPGPTITLSWTSSPPTVTSYVIYRSSDPSQVTATPYATISDITATSFVDQFAGGATGSFVYSIKAFNTTNGSGFATPVGGGFNIVGTGDGISGYYYNNDGDGTFRFPNVPAATLNTGIPQAPFVGNPPNEANITAAPVYSRIDPTLNYTGGGTTTAPPGAPLSWTSNNGIGGNFAITSMGLVQPTFNETYTFFPKSDDGIELFIYNITTQQWTTLDDNYNTGRGATEDTKVVPFQFIAGQKYAIENIFRQQGGGWDVELRWSSPSTAKALVPTSALYALNPLPVVLTATPNDGVALVTWGGMAADRIQIFRATSATGPFTTPIATLAGSASQFLDTSVTNGKTFWYELTGQTLAGGGGAVLGTSSNSNGAVSVVPGAQSLATPAINAISATSGNASRLDWNRTTLFWNSVPFATQYHIFRNTTTSFGGTELTTVTYSNTLAPYQSLTWVDSTVSMGNTYFYFLQAQNGTTVSAASASFLADFQHGVEAHYYQDQFWHSNTENDTGNGPSPFSWELSGVGASSDNFNGQIFGGVSTSTLSGTNYGPHQPDAIGFLPDLNKDYRSSAPTTGIGATSWSAVYTGKIHNNVAGTYTFIGNSDDDSYVYIDGAMVASFPNGHGSGDNTLGSVPVIFSSAGDHNVVVFYSQGNGGDVMRLRYSYQGQGIIPVSSFNTGANLFWNSFALDRPGQVDNAPVIINDGTNFTGGLNGGAGQSPLVGMSFVNSEANGTPSAPNTGQTVEFLVERADVVSGVTQEWLPVTTAGLGYNPGNTPITGTGALVSFYDATALPGHSYVYRVRGVNFDSVGDPSKPSAVLTIPTAATSIPGFTVGSINLGAEGHYYNDAFWGSPVSRGSSTNSKNAITSFGAGGLVDGQANNRFFSGSIGGGIAPFSGNNSPNLGPVTIPAGGANVFPLEIHNVNFSTVFTGRLHITTTGTYSFMSNTDDDGYIWVSNGTNQVLLSQDGGGHGLRNASDTASNITPIVLTAGNNYDFQFFQSNSGGGWGQNFFWKTPTASAFQLVPAQADVTSQGMFTLAGVPNAPSNFEASQYQLTFPNDARGQYTLSVTTTAGTFTTMAPNNYTVAATGTAGTFQLIVTSTSGTAQTTAALPFNDTAADIQTKLAALSNVGAGNVTVTGSAPNYTVVFSNITTRSLGAAGAGGGGANITSPLSMDAGNNNFNSTAGQVQTALQNLTGVGSGNVAVTQTVNGQPFTVTFNNNVALSGATPLSMDVTKVSPLSYNIALNNFGGISVGGTYTISVNTGTTTTTAAIPSNANTTQIQNAINALSNVGSNGVSVSGSGTAPVLTFTQGVAQSIVAGGITVNTSGIIPGVYTTTLANATGGTFQLSVTTATGAVVGTKTTPAASHFTARVVAATSGTFSLIVTTASGTATAAGLAFNASAATVQSAIQALTNLSAPGSVVVTQAAAPDGTYDIDFTGNGVTNMTATSALNSGASVAVGIPLAFNATAAQVQQDLNALANVVSGTGVTGGPAYVITFSNAVANTLVQNTAVSGNAANLTGATTPTITSVATTVSSTITNNVGSNVSAAINNNLVSFVWKDNADSEVRYVIERATDRNFTQNVTAFQSGLNSTQIGDIVQPNMTFFYRIRAENFDYVSPWVYASNALSPTNTEAVISANKMPQSVNVSATQVGSEIHVSWTNNNGTNPTQAGVNQNGTPPTSATLTGIEAGQIIQRSVDGGPFVNYFTTQRLVNTFTDQAVVPGHTYAYQVTTAQSVETLLQNSYVLNLNGATSGTFTLTASKGANNQTTGAQPFNVTAANLQTAIQGLSNIGSGNATVSQSGSIYTITFSGAAQNPVITVNTGAILGTLSGAPVLNQGSVATNITVPQGDFSNPTSIGANSVVYGDATGNIDRLGGFNATDAGGLFQLNGFGTPNNSTAITSDGRLRILDDTASANSGTNNTGQARTAWVRTGTGFLGGGQNANGGQFYTQFDFQVSGEEHADGFTFLLQRANNTNTGGNGGSFGAPGGNSVGVYFNLWQNVSETGLLLNGARLQTTTLPATSLGDAFHQVGVETGFPAILGPSTVISPVQLTGTAGAAVTAGTWNLSIATRNQAAQVTSANLPFNATIAQVQAALDAMSNVGSGNSIVSGSDGGPWNLNFNPALNGAVVYVGVPTAFTGNGSTYRLNVQDPPTDSYHATIQYDGRGNLNYTLTDKVVHAYNVFLNAPTAGTFTLTVTTADGTSQTTSALPFNATPNQVQNALWSLSNVGFGNLGVFAGTGGATYNIVFSGVLVINPTTGVVVNSSLTGTTAAPSTAPVINTFSTSFAVDPEQVMLDQNGFVGFTGGSGGDGMTADIQNWWWSPSGQLPPTNINGTGAADNVYVRRDSVVTNQVDYWIQAAPFASPPVQGTQTGTYLTTSSGVHIHGLGGADNITVDESNGPVFINNPTYALNVVATAGTMQLAISTPAGTQKTLANNNFSYVVNGATAGVYTLGVTTTGGVTAGTFSTQAFDNFLVSTAATGGTFKLTITVGNPAFGAPGTYTTPPISFGASTTTVAQAIDAADPNLFAGNPWAAEVQVTSGPTPNSYFINFNRANDAQLPVTALVADGSALTGTGASVNVLSPLAFNSTAAQVQTALQALANVTAAAGNVTVTGLGTSASPFQITFGSAIPVSNVTSTTGNLTGTGVSVPVTTPLAYNPSLSLLQSVIGALPGIGGAANVTVTQNAAGLGSNDGSPYNITFAPAIAAGITNFSVTPGGGVSATVTAGGGGNPSQFDSITGGGVSGTATLKVVGTSGADSFVGDGSNSRFAFNSTGLFSASLGGATAGTFTLVANTGTATTTAALAFNATAAQVQSALQLLSNVGVNGATVVGNNGGPYTIQFASNVPISTLTLVSALTGTTSTPATTNISATSGDSLAFSNVANVVYVDSGGTDTITANSGTTTITQSGADNVTVNSGATAIVNTQNNSPLTAVNNGTLTINAGAGNPAYTISGSGTTTVNLGAGTDSVTLNGTAATTINASPTTGTANIVANGAVANIVDGATNEAINVTMHNAKFNVATNGATSGTFTLVVNTGTLATTTAIPFNASAAAVQAALAALPNVGATGLVGVTLAGGTYTITFAPAVAAVLAATNPLAINSSLLLGGGAKTVTATGTALANITPGAGTPALTVNGGTATIVANTGTGIRQAAFSSISIGAAANLVVASNIPNLNTLAGHANRTLLVLNSLTLATSGATVTGNLDLNDNDLMLVNGGAAGQTLIKQYITSAANAGIGDFTGVGLTSSVAKTDPNLSTGLGYELNDGFATIDGNPISPFDGHTATANDVLVKFTYFGDTDLSGAVEGADYVNIDISQHQNNSDWAHGDFDYSGQTNGADYSFIDPYINFGVKAGLPGKL